MPRTSDKNAKALAGARDAAARGSWPEACAAFDEISDEILTPGDLEAKAEALWWMARIDDSMRARQKAYTAHLEAGSASKAAWNAWFLGMDYRMIGEESVASGWMMRARRDLPDDPSTEHGLVWIEDATEAHQNGDAAEALRIARGVADLGRRIGSDDITAVGLAAMARYSIATGHVAEGAKLLDEAMTFVAAGLTSSIFTGWIYCDVLGQCFDVADFRRASEWSDAAKRWYETMPGISPFHGLCRLHRVDVATFRGRWDEAEEDARRTSADLGAILPPFAAGAHYALGEINRRRGRLGVAEEEFGRAHGLGREPQPGLALVYLAQGNPAAAAAGLRFPLEAAESTPVAHACLLAARVEVAIANNDLEAAGAACKELRAVWEQWHSPILEALASAADSGCALAAGDAAGAARVAHRAVELFNRLRLPYDEAMARIRLGVAARRSGDEERARLELSAAREELEQLGAELDARRAAELLGDAAARGPLSDREVEVLRFVAAGKTNREIASEMVLSEHTISRHLQNIFRKLGVSSRAAATAYAFEHGLVGQSMV